MQNKRPTIKDVANKLGVATSTVSRALQNHPTISQKTKKLVKNMCEELGYRPNKAAANLRNGKGNYIGVVIPKINSSFMSNCIFGIEKVINKSGYNLLICQSNENYEKEVEGVRTLLDNQVSGILISLSTKTQKVNHLKSVISSDTPLIMFDRIAEDIEVDSVINSDFQATIEGVKHLFEQGYRKISLINVKKSVYVYKNRLEGFKQALNLFGLEKNEDWIIDGIDNEEDSYNITLKLLNSANPPDAFFCTNDNLALGIYDAVRQKKMKIPEQIGVIGYSNEFFSKIITPSLTSIEQYPMEIGVNAAELVLDLINKKELKTQKTISIKPTLIIRESTGGKK